MLIQWNRDWHGTVFFLHKTERLLIHCFFFLKTLAPCNDRCTKTECNAFLLTTTLRVALHDCAQNSTLTVFLACLSSDLPWLSKILALALSRSFLSMPSRRGMAPTRMAMSMSLKATAMLSVETISERREEGGGGRGRGGGGGGGGGRVRGRGGRGRGRFEEVEREGERCETWSRVSERYTIYCRVWLLSAPCLLSVSVYPSLVLFVSTRSKYAVLPILCRVVSSQRSCR